MLKVVAANNPTVKCIVFKGNKDVSDKELLPIFEAQLGKPQNIEMIGKAIDKIEKNFRDQGYVLARVVDLRDSGNGNCIVVIDEGVIGEVEIDGGQTLKEYLQKRIKIKPGQIIYNDRTLSNDLKDMQADGFLTSPQRLTLIRALLRRA